MRPPMNITRRLLIILLVVFVPLALLHETLIHIATDITFSRFLRRVPRLLQSMGFGIWTVWLGLIVYSCVVWFKNPKAKEFIRMLLTCVVLGSGFIWFLRMVFFFSMPGDGGH